MGKFPPFRGETMWHRPRREVRDRPCWRSELNGPIAFEGRLLVSCLLCCEERADRTRAMRCVLQCRPYRGPMRPEW